MGGRVSLAWQRLEADRSSVVRSMVTLYSFCAKIDPFSKLLVSRPLLFWRFFAKLPPAVNICPRAAWAKSDLKISDFFLKNPSVVWQLGLRCSGTLSLQLGWEAHLSKSWCRRRFSKEQFFSSSHTCPSTVNFWRFGACLDFVFPFGLEND